MLRTNLWSTKLSLKPRSKRRHPVAITLAFAVRRPNPSPAAPPLLQFSSGQPNPIHV